MLRPRLESPDGRARRRDPPRHAAAADAARARARVPPARATTGGRSSTPASAFPTRRRPGRRSSTQAGGRVATVFVTHFHPDHIGAAADLHELTGAPVVPGRARLRAVRARLGEPGVVGAASSTGSSLHGAPDDVTAELVGQSSRLPAVHPLPARPDPRRGRASTSTAGSSSQRPGMRTASSASCATVSSSPPTISSAGSRRRSGCGPRAVPIRSATISTRSSGRSSSRRDRTPGPRRPDRGSRGPCSRAAGAPPACGSRRPWPRSTAEPQTGYELSFAALRRRSAARGTAVRDRRDALASRAPRARGRRPTARGRRGRYLYCGLIDGRRDPA